METIETQKESEHKQPKIIYQNSEILSLETHDYSFIKTLKIVRIWRRKIIKIEGKCASPKQFKITRPGYDPTLLLKARARSKVIENKVGVENVEAKMMSLLNRLAPSNRVKLQVQLLEISLKSTENLKLLVEKIFQKICLEKKYTLMWVELCVFLMNKYKNPDQKGKNQFKTELLNISQLMFNNFGNEGGFTCVNKMRMMGNMVFLGELFKNKVIPKHVVWSCLESLLEVEVNEDKIEGAAILILSGGKAFLALGDGFGAIIDKFKEMIDKNKVSSRIKFLLMVRNI